MKSENMLFGLHQVLINRHDNKRRALGPHGFIKAKSDCFAKLVIFVQQDAIEGKQTQQQ